MNLKIRCDRNRILSSRSRSLIEITVSSTPLNILNQFVLGIVEVFVCIVPAVEIVIVAGGSSNACLHACVSRGAEFVVRAGGCADAGNLAEDECAEGCAKDS